MKKIKSAGGIKKCAGFLFFIPGFWFLVVGFLSGCQPTFPKEHLQESITELCRKEYQIKVASKVVGNTIAVYMPAEHLFDAVFNIDPKASKKMNDVILGVSRVTLSTDAKLTFYVVIAQDPQMPEIEIVYIRYVDDVKRFLLGDLSRGEYAKRAVIMLKTPPQAQRERILKELFAKLSADDADEIIKSYLKTAQNVTGIGEISYWNGRFFMKEIGLSEFLASQIEERIKMDFRQDKDLTKWYELKAAEGKYLKRQKKGSFVVKVNLGNRVSPLYLDSGIEIDAQKKRSSVLGTILGIAGDILWAYRYDDFVSVDISVLGQRYVVTKEQLWKIRKHALKAADLV